VLEASQKRGHPIPEAIQNAPELLPGLDVFYYAFLELNSERPASFSGMRAIPVSKIREAAVRLEYVQEEDQDYFVHMIRSMDLFTIKFHTKEKPSGQS
jgi:hypothetical protein